MRPARSSKKVLKLCLLALLKLIYDLNFTINLIATFRTTGSPQAQVPASSYITYNGVLSITLGCWPLEIKDIFSDLIICVFRNV